MRKFLAAALAGAAFFTSVAFAASATLPRDADGHWRAQARINGRIVQVLVDTGATSVALTAEDAKRAGLDPKRLRYTVRVRTANGETRAAAVKLDRVQIGMIRIDDVEALVVEQGLPVSLLGMSFLGRLEKFEVRSGALRLVD